MKKIILGIILGITIITTTVVIVVLNQDEVKEVLPETLVYEDILEYTISKNEISINKVLDESIDHIVIPNQIDNINVTIINDNVFSNCSNLVSVELSSNLKEIGMNAFNGTNISIITIPYSVVTIKENAFSNNNELFIFCENNKLGTYEETFNGDSIVYYNTLGKTVSIVDNSIYLLNNDESNTATLVKYNGVNTNVILNSITINEVTHYITTIGSYAFSNSNVTSVTCASHVLVIEEYAFNGCNKLKSIMLSNFLSYIGEYAFNSCTSIVYVMISTNINIIKSNAFANCGTSILVDGTEPGDLWEENWYGDCTVYYEEDEENQLIYNDMYYKIINDEVIITGAVDKNVTSLKMLDEIDGYPITQIASEAFKDCIYLQSITLSSNLKEIGIESFSGCVSLLYINLPETLESIAVNSFDGCYKTVFLFSGEIDFENSSSIPTSNPKYENCSEGSVFIENNIVYYLEGSRAIIINSFDLTNVVIPEIVTYTYREYEVYLIGERAFYFESNNIKSIEFPNTLTEVRSNAFSESTTIKYIIIPESLEVVQSKAFGSFVIFLSTQSVPSGWNSNYGQSTTTYLNMSDPILKEIDDCLYLLLEDEFILVRGSRETKEIEVQSSIEHNGVLYDVTTIGKYAFLNNDILHSIVLPSTIKSIEEYAFYYCINFVEINIPIGVSSLVLYSFSLCPALTIYCDDSKAQLSWEENWYGNATVIYDKSGEFIYDNFYYKIVDNEIIITDVVNKDIETINIPNSINGVITTKIDSYAFYKYTNLKTIVLPDTLLEIGEYAFYGCTSLSNVTLPEGLISIGERAFANCYNLIGIFLPVSLESLGTYTFYAFPTTVSILMKFSEEERKFEDNFSYYNTVYYDTEYDSCYLIDDTLYAFKNNEATLISFILDDTSEFIDLVIPETITYNNVTYPVVAVGDAAFRGHSKLKSIVLPNSVTTIGEYAFYKCSDLENVTLPNNLVSIGSDAFRDCRELISITLPNTIVKLEQYTFEGCVSLVSITLPDELLYIDDYVFRNCRSLETISFNDKLETIGRYAFSNTILSDIILPNSLTTIDSFAFSSITTLNTIYIPSSIKTMSSNIFSYSTLSVIYTSHLEKPSGWNSSWNSEDVEVQWGYNI